MQVTTLTDYILAHPFKGPFRVYPFYSQDGDFLSLYLKNDFCYEDQLSPAVSVYRSKNTKEVVGFKINNVKRLLKKTEQSP